MPLNVQTPEVTKRHAENQALRCHTYAKAGALINCLMPQTNVEYHFPNWISPVLNAATHESSKIVHLQKLPLKYSAQLGGGHVLTGC